MNHLKLELCEFASGPVLKLEHAKLRRLAV